ncbi:MAG TPA: DUF3108 domain-containing protein [Pyrinomonadaceae bacterium]|jgi:hypothetical protein|nr:DUF3108 domain-containing protein [Pyrinomonadaceae bacterium]
MKLLLSKINLIALVLLALSFSASAQSRSVRYAHPFEPSEELIYVGEFSRLLLKKVDVADFRFTATREPRPQSDGAAPNNSYALKLTGDISSRGFFSKLFNLHFHERMESTVDPTGFTVRKTNRLDEQGKRRRESETVFDNETCKLVWVERDPNNAAAGVRSVTTAFTGKVYDILSAIYFLRTQPLEVGKSFEVRVSDSGRLYRVPVKIVEKKRLKTVLGRVEVVRLDPDLHGPDGMISEPGELSIWLTSDSRRIPVAARLKTEYGTFDITLRKIVGSSPRKQS